MVDGGSAVTFGRRSVPYPTPDPLTANSRALMSWMGRTRPATEWRSTGSNLSIHETMGSRSASSLCQDVAGQPGSLSHLLQRLRLHLIRHLRISSGLCPLSVLTRALEGAKDVEYPQDTFRYPPFWPFDYLDFIYSNLVGNLMLPDGRDPINVVVSHPPGYLWN